MCGHPSQTSLRSRRSVACFTSNKTTRAGTGDTCTPKRVSSHGSCYAAQKTQLVQPPSDPCDAARAEGRFSDGTHPGVDPFAYPVATIKKKWEMMDPLIG